MQTVVVNSSTWMKAIPFEGWNVDISAPDTAQPNNGSSTGSSTSAKVGIGIGIALGAIGIIALISAFFLFRRRSTRNTLPPEVTQNHVNPYAHELDHTHAIHELGTQTRLLELPARI
jgi:hypothetical protein